MFKNKTDGCWALLFFFVVFGFVLFSGYRIWNDADKSAYKSCLLSLHTALIKSFKKNKALTEIINAGPEWRILSESELRLLFASLGSEIRFDCKNYPDQVSGRKETGESLRVAVRRRHSDGLIFVSIEGTDIDQEPFQIRRPIR